VDVLTLLGEDVGLQALQYQAVSMLDLPVHVWVGYRGLVHQDVAIITEIQDFFPSELCVVVGYDGLVDPKMENDVLHEIHRLPGVDVHQGPFLNPLSEFVVYDKQVGQAPGCFLEGPQKIQAPHGKHPCNGDCLELLGGSMDLPQEVLVSAIGPHDMCGITSGCRPVEILSESLPDHAS
jgi:hypothetical protein